ncbi:MAG: type II toxin-antitoxin system Phd/YefM family antitoxin [Flexilinea sp.]|nr:type II toxin-antitoxin system Phd/YefM family antitoxin [Flexilinea sp.]
MKIDTRNIVSMSEANQNFSRVARLVDERGSALIMKNNKPRYLIIECGEHESVEIAPDEKVRDISEMFIEKYHEAFVEMAK